MTNEEAIRYLNTMFTSTYIPMQIGETAEVREALDMAISALEKQTPKMMQRIQKPFSVRVGKCPCCGYVINEDENCRFCQVCGQRILWESEDA